MDIIRDNERNGKSQNGDGIYSHHIGRGFGENKSGLPIKTVDEVLDEAGEGVRWVQENTAARGALTDFSGLAKRGGKTTFWCHGIVAGARGEDHAGFATTPAKWLYLTEQGNNFAEALRDSGLTNYPDYVRIIQFKDVTAHGWDGLMRDAGRAAYELGCDAILVDTFAVFARLKASEENDAGVIGDRMRVLRLIAQTYDIAVVLIRHSGKDGTPRGSSAFEAEADICITISRPEGRHAPSVRHLSGMGRYGMWERNIQLHEGHYISLGADSRVEFNKAVAFIKAVLPNSPQDGMKKQAMMDRREGPDKEISASTLDRALAWLVKQGDVGEKQLHEERGQPKVYWLAYKPLGESGEKTNIYSHQTPSYSKEFGENKSDKRHSQGERDSEQRASRVAKEDKGVEVESQPGNPSSSSAEAPSGAPSGAASGTPGEPENDDVVRSEAEVLEIARAVLGQYEDSYENRRVAS